jgi:REP-associated tyrosine transposase
VQERKCLFGEVINGEMNVNRLGEIVKQCWNNIPIKYQNVETDEFVVMPDHVHGIIIINEDDTVVEAIHELPRRQHEEEQQSLQTTMKQRRQMLLPKIIGRFKMNSAKQINEINNGEGSRVWQRNYYGHVIRNEQDLIRIRDYISNNPAMRPTGDNNTRVGR